MSNETEIAKLRVVSRRIRMIGVRAENYMPVGRKVAQVIAKSNRRQFQTRGSYYGTPWRPLAPSTLKDKARHGFTSRPLVRTGDLKRSFTRVPFPIQEITKTSIRVGSDNRVARWQQYGTHLRGRRHIPPRVMQRIGKEMNEEILRVVNDYVFKGDK